jgi:hypothetical protein
MSAERVVVTRTEVARLRALVTEAIDLLDGILERPEPGPVETDAEGWPVLGDPEQRP